MSRLFIQAAAAAAVGLFLAPAAVAGPTVDAVKARGELICGVHTGLYGFGAPDDKGVWRGLDVDICRAVAAAVLGDAKKVKFVPLTAQQRLTALQSGEIDLLSRNTTWTLTRDTSNGLDFGPVTYFDGQGFLVPKKHGISKAAELKGASVCVQQGTTTEQNLSDYSRAYGLDLRPVTYEKYEQAVEGYLAGRCDAFTSDISQLASTRVDTLPTPDDHAILPDVISKEPLAPVVRQGDDQWFDILRWTVFAMFDAEERKISQGTVDAALESKDPNVMRLLGTSPGMGKNLGLDDKWAYAIIKQVGNYGEVFERNLGSGSRLKLGRGLNAEWINGGLMYSPPIR